MFRKFFTIIGTVGIFASFIGLVALMAMLRPKPELQEPELTPPAVFFTTVEVQAVTLDVSAQGEVRPRTDINLTAQVAGRVIETSKHFVNGGAFEQNDMLIKIEDADYRAAAAAAKARVAQAEQTLRLEEAEAQLAKRDYEELNLGDGGDPSDLTLRIPQLAQARANFEAAQAEYDAAQLNLERTAIRAPFKGRVRERIAGVGQYVSPGAQLGRIFSTDVAEIRLALTDSDLAKLGLPLAFTETEDNPGPGVSMSAVIAGEMHNWDGRIARTEGAIDAATRQVIAIAVVDDPYGEGADDGAPLAMGLYVDAVIIGKPYDDAIVLPRSALHGRDTVYSINDDNILVAHKVTVVSSGRDTITLAGGLEPGARIVTSPLRGADAGDEVSPADPLDTTPGADASDEPDPSVRTTAQTITTGE